MFHIKDGLYFERQNNGSVRILKQIDAKADSPIVFEKVLSRDEWCSVIASMSAYGENHFGFYRARAFHLNTKDGLVG